MNTRISNFVKIIGGEFWSGDPHACFDSVSIDTRTMKKGDCFFAVPGENFDGHDFIKDAVSKNASVVAFSRQDIKLEENKIIIGLPALVKVKDTVTALGDYAAFIRAAHEGMVVCVAGSNGKTTVKNMIAEILQIDGKTYKSPRNFNNLIGLPLSLAALAGDEKYAVLEAGISVPGEMKRLAAISSPDIAVMTNIGREHLGGLGGIDGVFAQETTLFGSIRSGGTAVVNFDDPRLRSFARGLSANVLGFSIRGAADAAVRADNIRSSPDGIFFRLNYGGPTEDVFINVNGAFNVPNALAAACVAKVLGLGAACVKKGLENFRPVAGRMQKLSLPNGCVIVNDAYNANPDSMRSALAAFCEDYAHRNKFIILGDMLELGDFSRPEHESLADFVMTLPFEEVLLVGGDMRFVRDRMKATHDTVAVRHYEDKSDLAAALREAKYIAPDSALFFKASHSVGLEPVVAKLYEERSREL